MTMIASLVLGFLGGIAATFALNAGEIIARFRMFYSHQTGVITSTWWALKQGKGREYVRGACFRNMSHVCCGLIVYRTHHNDADRSIIGGPCAPRTDEEDLEAVV